ncbi:MAG: GxxExxY protein [Opitutales bacterium]
MDANAISKEVVDAAVKVHQTLGPGLLESVYEQVLAKELTQRGLRVRCQEPISITYEGEEVGEAFKADIIVNDLVILELKSVEALSKLHHKQLFTYLKLSNKSLGLLLNFGAPLMKEGIVRVVNNLSE